MKRDFIKFVLINWSIIYVCPRIKGYLRFCVTINTFVSRSHYSCNNILDKGWEYEELIIHEYEDQIRSPKKSIPILSQTQSVNIKALQMHSTMTLDPQSEHISKMQPSSN